MFEKLEPKKHIFKLLIPNATVFISNFCIMVLELVAGRLIAKYLGVSLYTWTAVIGVILAGIAVGNYIGGRLADRFPVKKTISLLFIISSLLCIIILVLETPVSNLTFLKFLSLPLHIVMHILIVFFLPSAFMGMISPVAAKMALDMKQKTGYTIGNIYTWGAIGSIVGTFLTGYYFIAVFGTRFIIWFIAGILGLVGAAYGWKSWRIRIWLFILVASIVIGNSPWKWAQNAGMALGFQEQQNPLWIYTDESQYTYIKISRSTKSSSILNFTQDNLVHSKLNIENQLKLEYDYLKIFVLLTFELNKNKKKLATLQIGGGGYVFPRFLETLYPGSLIEVVEIDPAVTKAAMKAFGLQRDASINIHHMDGRDYINRLASQKDNKKYYDFIYIDAFNSHMVPWQITTLEFTEKLYKLLSNDGVFIMSMMEILNEARFLGPLINTMEEVFPHAYVLMMKEKTSYDKYYSHKTFVLVCTKKELDPLNFIKKNKKYLSLYSLSKSEISKIKKQSKGLILTDDYAPIENLLIKVVKKDYSCKIENKLLNKAGVVYQQGDKKKAIRIYNKVVSLFPDSAEANNKVGRIFMQMGKLDEAEKCFSRAIRINPERAVLYNNLGLVSYKKGDINKTLDCYLKAIKLEPYSAVAYNNLGLVFYQKRDLKKALNYFSRAVELDPLFKNAQRNLISVQDELGIRN